MDATDSCCVNGDSGSCCEYAGRPPKSTLKL